MVNCLYHPTHRILYKKNELMQREILQSTNAGLLRLDSSNRLHRYNFDDSDLLEDNLVQQRDAMGCYDSVCFDHDSFIVLKDERRT